MEPIKVNEIDRNLFSDFIMVYNDRKRNAYEVFTKEPNRLKDLLAEEGISAIVNHDKTRIVIPDANDIKAMAVSGAILVNDRHALKAVNFKVISSNGKSKDSLMPSEISIELTDSDKFDFIRGAFNEMGVKYAAVDPRGAGGKIDGFEITITGSQNIAAIAAAGGHFAQSADMLKNICPNIEKSGLSL